MDRWAGLAALVMVGVFAAPSVAGPSPTAAYPLTPRLFVVTSASYALAGDNVSLDVYTYTGGNLTDPDAPPFVAIGSPALGITLAAQGLARVGKGHYRAWVILPPIPHGGLQVVTNSRVVVDVSVAGTRIESYAYLTWVTPGLYLRLFSNPTTVSWVQPLHLTAQIYNGSRLVDADANTVFFQAVNPLGPRGGPMTPNRTTVGVYEADVVLDSATVTGFTANATVRGLFVHQTLGSGYGPPFFLPPAFTPASYQAWFQSLSTTPTEVRGTLWVADAWGVATPGVPVSLEIVTTGATINATTDDQGRVPLELNLTNGFARVMGMVGGGGPESTPINVDLPYGACFQGFNSLGSGGVSAADPAILQGGELRDFLTPGTSVVRKYHVVNASAPIAVPLAYAPLDYYLVGFQSGSVYAAGQAITDAQGDFSLSFTVPPEQVRVTLDIQGVLGSPELFYSVASPALGLHVSSLTLGGPTEVRASFPSRAAPWVNSNAILALDTVGVLASSGQNWTKWTQDSGCAFDYLRGTNAGLNATLFLPSFLPSTGRYLVDAEAWTPSMIMEQFVILSPGQSADIPVGGTQAIDVGIILFLAVIGIVLAGIGVVGVMTLLRRRPKTPPKPPPAPPSP